MTRRVAWLSDRACSQAQQEADARLREKLTEHTASLSQNMARRIARQGLAKGCAGGRVVPRGARAVGW
eukprot:5473360-Prymnesium_polylepis.1